MQPIDCYFSAISGACPSGYSGTGATSCTGRCFWFGKSNLVFTRSMQISTNATRTTATVIRSRHAPTRLVRALAALALLATLEPAQPNALVQNSVLRCFSRCGTSCVLCCPDIDECATNNGYCDPLTTCTNAPGSFSCGSCPPGYTGNGANGCHDIE